MRVLLLIAVLQGTALAGPTPSDGAPSDPNGAVTASDAPAAGSSSPWIDLAPSNVLEKHAGAVALDDDVPHEDHKLRAALELGGFYVGFSAWAYVAWYRNHPPLSNFKVGGDGWFGVETYAGGADKFGHLWATMALGRMGTAILTEGGWDHTSSTLLSAALSELVFLNVEIRDGLYFEFSPGDLTLDTIGALIGIAMDLSPRLDELFDFRVQYFPSARYIDNVDGSPNKDGSPSCPKGGCSRWNIAEDYSGQSYLLALHLGAIHPLRERAGTWTRFVDVGVGFQSRGYKPPPDPVDHVVAKQELFVGVSLNAQGLFDYLLEGGKHEALRKVSHGIFEVFNLPYTILGAGVGREAPSKPHAGGA